MKTYRGTEEAPEGVYLKLNDGEFVQLHGKTRLLPGARDNKYVKVPAPLAVIAGPFAGLAFIIFLPFAGIIGFVGYLGYLLWRGIITMERWTLQLAAAGWNPGRAYFTKHGGTQVKGTEDRVDEELAELEEEVTTRRQRGEQ